MDNIANYNLIMIGESSRMKIHLSCHELWVHDLHSSWLVWLESALIGVRTIGPKPLHFNVLMRPIPFSFTIQCSLLTYSCCLIFLFVRWDISKQCSFPFTYIGQLLYQCIASVSNSADIGCYLSDRTWVTCSDSMRCTYYCLLLHNRLDWNSIILFSL